MGMASLLKRVCLLSPLCALSFTAAVLRFQDKLRASSSPNSSRARGHPAPNFRRSAHPSQLSEPAIGPQPRWKTARHGRTPMGSIGDDDRLARVLAKVLAMSAIEGRADNICSI